MPDQKSLCGDATCESSCWQEALEKLRQEDPDVHQQLERILAMQEKSLSRTKISDQIVKSIQANKSRMEDRSIPSPWRHRDEGEKAKAKKAMNQILKAVLVFRDVGNSLASIEPSHVGVAWGGINLVLQIILGGSEQNSAAIQGLAQISPIITRYAKVEEIYFEQRKKNENTTLNRDFKTQVVDLYVKILEYQVAITTHCQRSTITQYVRAIPKLDNWSGLLEEISAVDAECRNFTQIFDSEDNLLQHRELKQILEEQDERMDNVSTQLNQVYEQNQILIEEAEQREAMAILSWVSQSPPNDDHTRILEHGKLNNEYANSGQWLFSCPEFRSWGEIDNQDESVLWLRGPVGTGKSSLVCLIIENFLKGPVLENNRIAYFYCSKKQGTEDANSTKTVLQSILRQLAWSTSDLSVAPTIKAKYIAAQRGPAAGTRRLTADECLQMINQLVADYYHTTILIDALDECSDFFELLSYLVEISSASQGKVRFLLSSRMNVPVHQFFPKSSTIEVGQDSGNDIDFFIATEMARNKRRLAQCNALDLEAKMTRVLSHRAQGMFRWVELQLTTFFNSRSSIKRRDAFKRKLEKLDKEVGIPVLTDVYDDIYEINTPEPEDRQVAERALKWVMCCQRPLSIEMMVKAASFDLDGNFDEEVTAEYILDICSNFIIVDHNQMVQFAHLSVREYLMNDTRLSYTSVDAHAQVAKTALVYLNACSISEEVKDGKKDDLLAYTALYWPCHCIWGSKEKGKESSILGNFLAVDEPNMGFVLCMDLWPELIRQIDYGESRKIERRIEASVSPSKSPIFTACAWGFRDVVQAAISSGFDLDERNDGGNTPLYVATDFDEIEIMELLLKGGADPNAIGKFNKYTPLHTAYRNIETVKLLVQYGADVTRVVEGPINSGWTLLHLGACHKMKDVIEFALDHGADINKQTKVGQTALHLASGYKRADSNPIEIAQVLLDRGADTEIQDEAGETALKKAAIHGNDVIVQLMLKHQGKEADSEKWLRQARFHNAVSEGDEDLVRSLIKEGVDTEVKATRGTYPIHWAAQKGATGVALALLDNGADIDARDKFRETPLYIACISDQRTMMEFLLDKGADIDAILGRDEDEEGRTILQWAIAHGMASMVELLMKRGADPRKVDLDSLKPDYLVKWEDFEACVKMVRSWSS